MRRILSLVAFVVLTFGVLVGCDQSEQNIGWRPGNSLAIAGEAEVEVPTTESYFVRAFTIEKNYEWTVTGESASDPEHTVRRDGEYLDVTFEEAGEYTITVSDGEYEGALTVIAEAPDAGDGGDDEEEGDE